MEQFIIKAARPFGVVALVLCVGSIFAIVGYAPTERVQGVIQKIMYVHVPSAITCYVAFIVAAVSSGLYLWQRKRQWDRIASCSVELGILFCSVVLTTGPLWGKPIWGVWWSWDARLTSTLLLWLIFIGYFVLRRLSQEEQGARFAAVLAIIGVLDIPFINVAAEKFQTLHPPNVLKGGLTQEMGATLILGVCTAFVFYWYMLGKRLEIEVMQAKVHEIEERAEG